jgi:hypothetical protein
MNEEEFCHHMLSKLRESYEKQAQQWIDCLVKIKQRSIPRFVLLPSNANFTGPTTGPASEQGVAGSGAKPC